jgi:riboflavin transporter FmnP
LLSVSAVWVADDVSTKLMASSSIIDNRAEAMTGAVMLILGFYFALPKVTEIANAAIDKFGQRPGGV